MEKQWFECLQNLPNGVLLYDKDKKQVVFENAKLKSMLSQPNQLDQSPEDRYLQQLVMKMTDEQQKDLAEIKKS